MTETDYNRIRLKTAKCPRGQAVFCDGTPNLSQKGNKQMKACRYFKEGKCQRTEGAKQ